MREPVFNETVQLGIVVRDLEATVRRCVDDYGIGPWQFAQIDAGDANNYREYARPVERSTRIAVATVGQLMWKLIEPLDEEGIYARFLAEKGEGIHPSAGKEGSRKSGPAVPSEARGARVGRTAQNSTHPIYLSVDAPPPVPQYHRRHPNGRRQ
jgi:Glyoxalase/Bleomycin resistance protein/Dioxygenase superfamily